MANKAAKRRKKDELDPYKISVVAPNMDFPFWEQTIVRAWLEKELSREEMMEKDALELWEAVFWAKLNRKPSLLHINSEHLSRDFSLKAFLLARSTGLDAALLHEQINELDELYDAAKRAIIVEKIQGYDSRGAYWVLPKSFMSWYEDWTKMRADKLLLTKDKRKAIREKSYQKIVEHAKTLPCPVPVAELIEDPVISEVASMYIRLAPKRNPQSGKASLLEKLRKDPDVPKIGRGKQIRKSNKKSDFS